jgi:hypothetical protein
MERLAHIDVEGGEHRDNLGEGENETEKQPHSRAAKKQQLMN